MLRVLALMKLKQFLMTEMREVCFFFNREGLMFSTRWYRWDGENSLYLNCWWKAAAVETPRPT